MKGEWVVGGCELGSSLLVTPTPASSPWNLPWDSGGGGGVTGPRGRPDPVLEARGTHPAWLQGPALLIWHQCGGVAAGQECLAGGDLGSGSGKRDIPGFSQASSHLLTSMTRGASVYSDTGPPSLPPFNVAAWSYRLSLPFTGTVRFSLEDLQCPILYCTVGTGYISLIPDNLVR